MLTLGGCLVLGSAAPARAAGSSRPEAGTAAPRAAFARGVAAFRAGDYARAGSELTVALGAAGAGAGARSSSPSSSPSPAGKNPVATLHNPDWARFLRAESAFFIGQPAKARADFEALVHARSPRFASVAAYRIGDCLWSAGDHGAAAEVYRKLSAHPSKEIDAGVARFRLALFAEERGRAVDASKLFLAFYRDFPAHPWSDEAQRHLAARPTADGAEGSKSGAMSRNGPALTGPVTSEDQLRRAEALSRDRSWEQALEVLAHLPADLPPALATQRDYQVGMTKFNMRRDYLGAAQLLLAVAPRLSGDQAASAWFHGTRALSRIDRDDEAIAGYKQVVARFPASRFAAEAQFLSGWLDYNRGRYRESLPGLRATLEHFGRSAFADDAAFCVAFASFLLGDWGAAAQALGRYAALPPTGMTVDEQAARVAYWRARLAAKMADAPRAAQGYREVNQRWPFTFYGVAARARLAESGAPAGIELPGAPAAAAASPTFEKDGALAALVAAGLDRQTAARLDELASAGLDVEAGWELEREEKVHPARGGSARGKGGGSGGGPTTVPHLLGAYASLQNFHRAYELAESRNAGALGEAPMGTARVWWQAAYPLAYRGAVEKYGRRAGNPDLFLYAIMRKESGFSPWDVSYADARGLLQMIPPTSARVAREANLDFSADDLFDPDTNIHLGALYIGGLARKFHAQIPLVAGAYNAGPRSMAKWCDQHGTHPMDEFVELIAFTQTREYAKRVVGIYARYRQLYGTSPYTLPLVVDPHYEAAGPDF